MKKRIISSLLVLVMVLSLLPATAFAAEPDPIADQYKVDGVTYFGVDSDHFDDSTKLFIQDMLSANSKELDGKSTAALWQYLAYCIQDVQGRGTSPDGKFKTHFDTVIPKGLAYTTGNTGTYSDRHSTGGDTYIVRSSGLVYAGSMAAAAEAMEDQMFHWYHDPRNEDDGTKGGAGGGRNDKYGSASSAAIAKNSTLWDDTDPDDVYWMATGAYKTSGTNKKGHYQALGVLFSDFSVTTILPEDSGNFYVSTEVEAEPGSKTYASSVKNMTDAQVSAQQEISNTTSSTATSEINGSKSYGFEESINLGYEVTALNSKFSLGIGFTTSQTIENGWSEEKSCTDEQTTSYNVSVELPAYTNVMLKQTTGTTTTTTNYNCPVALNFTVTIVEYTLDPNDNNAACQTQVLATFGANARKDLKQRGVIEYTLTDPDGVRWSDLYNAHSELWGLVENKLTATAPMASTGAKFTAEYKTVNNEVSGLAPIYALSTIKTANDIMEYNLSSGEYLYVDPIELEGLNAKNAAYYGFNQDKGRWILVDEDGEELTGSSVASLETNPVSGHTKLVAGQEAGTVYLKYLIDEDCYATAERPTACTRNIDLASTATIEVNVSEIPFDKGSIQISGTLSGIVGDPEKPIEGTDGLTVTVEDSTGKEVSRPVVWEAKELETKGIKVEDNQISFTKEGTFQVRAKTGNVYSDWYEVTALPARKLAAIQIPEAVEFDYQYQKTMNLAGLLISYQDQYGADWTEIPTLTWTCDDEGVTITDGVLTVPSAGVYTVTASAGDITSNTLTITVTDSSFVDVPADAYYYDAVLWAARNGITVGMDDTHFAPNATCTRAQVVTFLWRAAGSPAPESSTMPFTDVATDAYYYDAVLWAVENGCTLGTTTTTFAPNATCTRAQIVTILWRSQASPAAGSVNPFTDVASDAYYYDAVLWAVANDITRGTTDTTFSPDADCTRAQIVTFLYRCLG